MIFNRGLLIGGNYAIQVFTAGANDVDAPCVVLGQNHSFFGIRPDPWPPRGSSPAQSSNCTAQGIHLLRDRISVLERERSVLDDPPRRPLVHIFARPSRQEAHSSSDTFLVCTQEGWWLYNTGDQSQLIFPGRVALEV